MRQRHVVLLVLATALVALAGAQAAYPDHGHGRGHHHGRNQAVVFVQTNEPSGNRIVVFDRGPNGTLSAGGRVRRPAETAASRHRARSPTASRSQGSLAYDARHSLLIAVNAGSDTVSTFKVHGDRLQTAGIVPSGGQFPASIAVHGRLVYVLNAGGDGDRPGVLDRGPQSAPDPGLGAGRSASQTATRRTS